MSEKCPNCSVTILKNGGCPHILCLKCNFQFCWLCLGSYPEYNHVEKTFCPLRQFIFKSLILFSFFFVNFKLAYVYDMVSYCEKFALYYGFLMIFVNCYLYITIMTTRGMIKDVFRRTWEIKVAIGFTISHSILGYAVFICPAEFFQSVRWLLFYEVYITTIALGICLTLYLAFRIIVWILNRVKMFILAGLIFIANLKIWTYFWRLKNILWKPPKPKEQLR